MTTAPPSRAEDLALTHALPVAGVPARRTALLAGWRLPVGVAFGLEVSILVFMLAASSASTPLYAIYQAEWGFSPITITTVFGVYALAVLASLLTVGSLSDHVGRRPVLLVALLLQALAAVVFATAGGVPELMAARVIQGLATGAAAGALGAGLLDLDKRRGTIANGVAPLTGTGLGAVAGGLFITYLPAPTHLIFLVLAAVFVLQALGIALMAETSSPKAGALASLRPQVGLPQGARRPMLLAIPALVAVWSLAGLYGSLGPSLIRSVVGSSSLLLGGLPLFVIAVAAAVTVLFIGQTAPRRVMLVGATALLAGVGITLLAISTGSAVVFFVGAAVAGVGFGAGFQGALRSVLPLAAPHERAGVLSTIYVVCYLAMGLPAVVAGFLVVHGGGVLTTAREYGVTVMVLAALALLGLAVPHRRPAVVAPERCVVAAA